MGRKPLVTNHAHATLPHIFRYPLEEGGGFLWLIERRKHTFAQLQNPGKTRRMSSLFDRCLDSGWACQDPAIWQMFEVCMFARFPSLVNSTKGLIHERLIHGRCSVRVDCARWRPTRCRRNILKMMVGET
jgi:hypothetical protein